MALLGGESFVGLERGLEYPDADVTFGNIGTDLQLLSFEDKLPRNDVPLFVGREQLRPAVFPRLDRPMERRFFTWSPTCSTRLS